jgi:hypothetical protein
MTIRSIALAIQALVYLGTGLWSVLSRSTFERVTGPKTDYWLVRMVGLLAVVIGAALAAAVYRDTVDAPTLILAIGSALSFAAIDLRYAIPRRISRIYLLDAVFELALALVLALSR